MKIIKSGASISNANAVLIALHGRGAQAESLLSVTSRLALSKDFAIWAPEASGRTWYPYSFMAPLHQNQPYLDDHLSALHTMMEEIYTSGILSTSVYLMGFSQGACMALEFAARHARRYGGVIAFTGGLIGEQIYPDHYHGDFEATPIFIGSSDVDPHVPLGRVRESSMHLKSMGAEVMEKIYPGMPHTINEEEINSVNQFMFPAK